MRLVLKMRALEPISVGFESIGIETILYSIPIIKEDGTPIEVPIVPGNSLRGILRDEMAMQFLEDVKEVIEEDNTDSKELNAHVGTLISMFSGGILASKEESESKEPNVRGIMESYVYPLLPLSIMGVALKKIMIPSKIKVGIGYPLTKETLDLINDLIEDNISEFKIPSLSDITASVLITRKNDETKILQLKDLMNITGEAKEYTGDEAKVQQKLYRQVVVPGTVFYSYVEEIIPLTPAERGLLIKTLKRINRVGGSSVRGLGKIKLELLNTWNEDESIIAYKRFLEKHKEKILRALSTDPTTFFKKKIQS